MCARSLKLGLIGCGRIGTLHAEHLSSRIAAAQVVIVADAFEDAAKQCAERYAIPFATQDYHDILVRPDVDAVIICSPTDTHAQIIEDTAWAGKHIFCEKPIALDLLSIDKALKTVELANVKLQVGFNRRFDANYRRVQQAVEHGEIGLPHLLHLVSRDPTPPSIDYIRTSGGLFLDMTIHDFDMARFLIGSEVEEIFALAGAMDNPAIGALGDVDTAVTTMRFNNGVIATIDNSRRAVYGYDQRVELFGTAGAIHTGNTYPNSAIISDGRSIWRDLPHRFFAERYTESFLAEMTAFVQAILHDEQVAVTGQDGRVPVVMALAAQRSLIEKRAVHLSEIEHAREAL